MMKIGNKIKLDNYHHNYRLNKYNNNSEKHEFDRELRLLNLELLEKIELNFKKYLINFFEENGGVKNKRIIYIKIFRNYFRIYYK
ncbi:MAG: hypothetical protein Q9M97_04950 [Candidatus Gracilibacteria bacterium]|nr:hypothetical protein [Candidatus Gracilibacteria bacterium]